MGVIKAQVGLSGAMFVLVCHLPSDALCMCILSSLDIVLAFILDQRRCLSFMWSLFLIGHLFLSGT